jgi:hypothetical protein
MIRSGLLIFDLKTTESASLLVPFLNQFGNLYYGNLTPKTFAQQYLATQNQFVQNLISIEKLSFSTAHNLGCLVNLIHDNQYVLQWTYPALVTDTAQGFNWTTGNQRLIATGMRWPRPWQHLKTLLLSKHLDKVGQYLDNPLLITSDQQLQESLNIDQDTRLDAELIADSDGVTLLLDYMGPVKSPQSASQDRLAQYRLWHKRCGSRPTLNVYTDWPEMLSDRNSAWNINIVGSCHEIREAMFSPGHLENNLRKQHAAGLLHDITEHTLYIIHPRNIDAGDLLCWMNLNNNVFVDQDLEFLLYRPENTFTTTFISASHVI